MSELKLPCVGLRCGTWRRHETGSKAKLLVFLELGRPYTMLSAFLVGVFLGIIVNAGWYSILLGFMFAAGQGFGQSVNQIADVEIDRVNKPYRPIPSGRVDIETAWAYALAYYILGLFFSFWLGVRGFLSYLLLAFFAFFYSAEPLRAKEAGAWQSLFWQAVSRGLLPPLVAMYIFGGNLVYLSLLAFLWVLSLQATKDFGDVEGDRLYGVRTLPVVYGTRKARLIMLAMLTIYIAALSLLLLQGLVPLTMVGIIPVALLAIYGLGYTSPTENNLGWNLYYAGLALHYLLWLMG